MSPPVDVWSHSVVVVFSVKLEPNWPLIRFLSGFQRVHWRLLSRSNLIGCLSCRAAAA